MKILAVTVFAMLLSGCQTFQERDRAEAERRASLAPHERAVEAEMRRIRADRNAALDRFVNDMYRAWYPHEYRSCRPFCY